MKQTKLINKLRELPLEERDVLLKRELAIIRAIKDGKEATEKAFQNMSVKDYYRHIEELRAENFRLKADINKLNYSECKLIRKLEILEKPKPKEFIMGCVLSNSENKYTEDELANLFLKWCAKIGVRSRGNIHEARLDSKQ